ncbi:MAG TPA: DoxX family protein [Acidobacteriaceae bacterium]|jgi:DoxX-like protein|nr:DoxX family protein [Acidobacteriaceae bacterium]
MTAALTIILIVLATAAGVLASMHEADATQSRARLIAYWLFTIVVAFELAAGALWDLLHIEFVRASLVRLGYPQYLLYILGAWRIPGTLALLVPRFPRLKEWAYAGAFFDFTGAAASLLFIGARPGQWIVPLIFAAFTLLSSALRPPSRRLPSAAPAGERHWLTWSTPILITAAMLVVAFLTLPKGPPHP